MSKPLVKININLATAGFKVVQGKGENKDKRYIFAEITDEISINNDNQPIIKLVGWELKNNKGTAPLKIDYEDNKKYTGADEFPPTIGWCNVSSDGSNQPQADQQPTAPISADDLPI